MSRAILMNMLTGKREFGDETRKSFPHITNLLMQAGWATEVAKKKRVLWTRYVRVTRVF